MPFGLPDTVLTTELDAVNFVMVAKGLDLVTSIDLDDAEIASAAFQLNAADLGFQSKGWWFNKDYSLSLAVDSNGNIPLPAGTLGVAPAYWSGCRIDFTERAGKLYDLTNHTFTFTDPQLVDIIVRLPYEDMPDVARRYVAYKAAHVAQGLDPGRSPAIQITNQNVLEALTQVEWKQDEAMPANQVHSNLSLIGTLNSWGQVARIRTT